jgi:uncharacterized membrane protein YbhN (UPF0104 family)
MCVLKIQWAQRYIQKIVKSSWCYAREKKIMAMNLFVTLVILSSSAMLYVIGFSAVNIYIDNWLVMIAFYGIIIIVNYLPITLGGIGLGELVSVYLWGHLGILSEKVLAAFVIIRCFALLSTIILSGATALVWLYSKKTELIREV